MAEPGPSPSTTFGRSTFILVGLLTFSSWGCDSVTAEDLNFYAPDMQTAPALLLPDLLPVRFEDDAVDLACGHHDQTVDVLRRRERPLLPDDEHARRKASAGMLEALQS